MYKTKIQLVFLCYKRTENILFIKLKELKIVAEALLKKETIFESDLIKLIGERPINFNKSYGSFAKKILQ